MGSPLGLWEHEENVDDDKKSYGTEEDDGKKVPGSKNRSCYWAPLS